MRYALPLLLLTSPAIADDGREDFYGTWGTAKQCSGAPVIEGVDVFAQPFEIRPGWLKHGQFWCKLNWGPIEARKNGSFTAAFATCGEDSVRNYFLGMEIIDEALTLRWDFPLSNGPLARCPES